MTLSRDQLMEITELLRKFGAPNSERVWSVQSMTVTDRIINANEAVQALDKLLDGPGDVFEVKST